MREEEGVGGDRVGRREVKRKRGKQVGKRGREKGVKKIEGS